MADKIQVITNNTPRFILAWYDLSRKEQAEFDYLDTDDKQCDESFIRYMGRIYLMSDFMRIEHGPEEFNGWHGYSSDSYFSGVLIKLCPDSERVIMARYFS